MVSKKKNKKNLIQYGSIIFGVGLAIAIIGGFFSLGTTAERVVIATLILLGIFVGFLNITNNEAESFLVASVALILLIGPFLGLISQYFVQSQILGRIFSNLIAVIVPAAVIVALRTIFITAKDEN